MAVSKKLRTLYKDVEQMIDGDDTKFYVALVYDKADTTVYAEGAKQELETPAYLDTPADHKVFLGDDGFKEKLREHYKASRGSRDST